MPKKKRARARDTEPTEAAAAGGAAEDGNIDQVRELLFGAQARDFDSRIERLGERLTRDAEALRAEINGRLDSLEEHIRAEFRAVGQAQKEERQEREKGLRDVERALTKSTDKLRAAIDDTREKLQSGDGELRESLLQEAKKLRGEIADRHKELGDRLDAESRELRETLTDRQALGDLLTEVGLRLKNEFHLPEPD